MVADALVRCRAALLRGYRGTGSRIAIQLIADQRQVLAGASFERRGVAIESDHWALTSVNVVQNRLIKKSGSAGGNGLETKLNWKSGARRRDNPNDNTWSGGELQVR